MNLCSTNNNPCTNDSNVSNENETIGMGTSTNSGAGNVLSSMQQTASSNVITNNCFIANAACNNNNASSNSGSQADVSLLNKSPARDDEMNDDDQNSYSGYNSGDEHNGQKCDLTPEEWEERDKLFIKTMSDRGFVIEQIVEDGACLFRSISLQIYGDQDMHEIIRQQTMDYIVSKTSKASNKCEDSNRLNKLIAMLYAVSVSKSRVFHSVCHRRHQQLCIA